ncbi:MAG: TetR/AcrR family transcriptional regulator [Actinomycetota bacterium]
MPSQDRRESDDPVPGDRRVIRTRALIGQAVQELFIAEGWDAITHQRVADHANVGRNTVYRHFPDRTSLLFHGGHFDEVHHASLTGDLRTDLINELRTFRYELHEGIVGNVIAAMCERADRDPELRPVRDALVAAGSKQTADLIQAAMDAGRMDDSVPIHDLVAVLCGPLLYSRLCLARPLDEDTIEQLVDTHLQPADTDTSSQTTTK